MSYPPTDKGAVRSLLLAARAGLAAPTRREAEQQVARRLLTLPELTSAHAVLGYASFGSELDIDSVLRALIARGTGVFLPRVEGQDLHIERVRDLEADLAPGWRGVREPRLGDRRPARPDRLHAAIVPGVGFDRRGYRLGYGGGHFDRLLARLDPQAATIGVAFRVQVVDHLPRESHDRPVGVLVTEEGVHRPPR